VISFGHFWWRYEGDEIKIDSVKIDGDEQKTLTQGKTYEGITIEENFQQGAKVRLGENITIESISVNSNTEIVISAKVASDAKPGRRSLIVINPDCSVGM
jgi:hypothetical protein